jgi:hypothetical protein
MLYHCVCGEEFGQIKFEEHLWDIELSEGLREHFMMAKIKELTQ